nr:unnamed protein product [Callosobruchus chinensis]
MMQVLEAAGIRGVPNKLFRSYLSERSQMVKIGVAFSTEKQLKYRLPQGTVLAPILLNLYVNSILTSAICGQMFSYADDMAVLHQIKSNQIKSNPTDNTWDT